MDKIFLINGPNLNLLGTRSPDIYGSSTLADVLASVEVRAKEYKLKVESLQSNHEGELIDFLQRANHEAKAVIINPGGYAHTSVALRDAVEAVSIPVIEVHISNIFAREPFRHQSYISEVSDGVICGLGTLGYQLAVEAAAAKISL